MPTPPLTRKPARDGHRLYILLLGWAFTCTNLARAVSYLPTIWAIHASGRSDQHSLLTWLCWLGANLTMAAWLFERNGRRFDGAVGVNGANALLCGVTLLVILWYR